MTKYRFDILRFGSGNERHLTGIFNILYELQYLLIRGGMKHDFAVINGLVVDYQLVICLLKPGSQDWQEAFRGRSDRLLEIVEINLYANVLQRALVSQKISPMRIDEKKPLIIGQVKLSTRHIEQVPLACQMT